MINGKLNFFTMKSINWGRTKKWTWAVFRTIIIVGVAFMILYPVIIKFITSIKSYSDMFDPTVIFIPKNPTLKNFQLVIDSVNYPIAVLRTVLITAFISMLQIISCTLVSYGLARFKFPGQKIVFAMVILTLIIPPQAILLPLYIRFRFFNPFEFFAFGGEMSGISLIDTLWPFVLLSVGANAFKNGLYIYLLRQHFRNMPKVLEEAAYIDGCGRFATFWHIMLKGAVTMIVTVFLFAFVWQWNDYYYSSVLAPKVPVLANELMNLNFSNISSTMGNMYNSMVAAPKFLLQIIPLLILYMFTQRFFTESIEKSGIVG